MKYEEEGNGIEKNTILRKMKRCSARSAAQPIGFTVKINSFEGILLGGSSNERWEEDAGV